MPSETLTTFGEVRTSECTCQKVGCYRDDTQPVVVNDRGGYKLFCPDHANA